MPRSPAPNISVPVLAAAGACWVEVVLLLLDPELLSSLPHAARNSANAPAPAVPPTALRNRLRSDGSVASRSMAPSCICRLHVLLVETGSARARQQIRLIRATTAGGARLMHAYAALLRRRRGVLAVAGHAHAVDAGALDPQALRVDGLARGRRRLEQRSRDRAELAGLRAALDQRARAVVAGPDAAGEAYALAALRSRVPQLQRQ